MDTLDFRDIVGAAAQRVESHTGVAVDAGALEVLLSRAVEHQADVYRAMAEQSLTRADLVDAAERQLREALPFATSRQATQPMQQQQMQQQQMQQQQFQQQQHQEQQRPRGIGAEAVRAGMRSKCWFVPWC